MEGTEIAISVWQLVTIHIFIPSVIKMYHKNASSIVVVL